MIFRFPECMGCIKNMVIALRPFEEVEFDKSGLVFQVSISCLPNFLKFRFLPFYNFEPVHSNVMTHIVNNLSTDLIDANIFILWLCKTLRYLTIKNE